MIRYTEFVMSVSQKVNLGNYENRDIFLSAKVELTDGTLIELGRAHLELKKKLKEMLEEEVRLTRGKGD